MSAADFQECETCAAKPGAIVLCAGCLNNRNLIATHSDPLGRMATALESLAQHGRTEAMAEVERENKALREQLTRWGSAEYRLQRMSEHFWAIQEAGLRHEHEARDDALAKAKKAYEEESLTWKRNPTAQEVLDLLTDMLIPF